MIKKLRTKNEYEITFCFLTIQSQIKCTKWENQKFSMSNCSKIQFGIQEPLSPFSIT